jgi:hypothetical protein
MIRFLFSISRLAGEGKKKAWVLEGSDQGRRPPGFIQFWRASGGLGFQRIGTGATSLRLMIPAAWDPR